MSETKRRAKYTLEFELEAVRLVKGGQVASVTAKILGIPKAIRCLKRYIARDVFGLIRHRAKEIAQSQIAS